VVETIALALLCSSKELDVLQRFMEGNYSKAIRDVNRHADRLGVVKEAMEALRVAEETYHDYSHPSHATIAAGMSFTEKGSYVGASFDEGKLDGYAREVGGRVGLAAVFSSFVDGVKANVGKWRITTG
jgi:hypothetical protein